MIIRRKKYGLQGKNLIVGEYNLVNEPLVEREKIILPPLNIKLGIIKQFVKALNKEGKCFEYICKLFPGSSVSKLEEGILDGPKIRQLIRDPNFNKTMTNVEAVAWASFVSVVKNFLGNYKADNYEELVKKCSKTFITWVPI